jgi:hypothetical protein
MSTTARPGSLWLGAAGLFAATATAVLNGGCSVLFHVDADQCSTTSDCLARGADFAGAVCKAGTCVLVDAGAMTMDSSLGLADTGPDTSMGVGGDAGPDAAAMDASEAGVDAGPACTTYAECPIPVGNHPEVTCSPDTHTCIQLTTDQCPFALGDYKYTKQIAPIVIGAFATFPTNPTDHPSYRNYALAISEFTSQAGIPAGPGNTLRMPVAVLCNDDTTQVTAGMNHLANDVHVPAVITALDSADVKATFSNYGFQTTANLFIVNPFGADSTLTALTRGAQLWHMLGTPNDLAGAYRALIPRIENYIRTTPPWSLGPTNPLRIATVTAQATVLTDLAGAVTMATQPITWNNGNGQFASSQTASFDPENLLGSTLNGTPLSSIDVTTAVSDLLAFQPHVVISFASDEFITLLQTLDLEWASTRPDGGVNGPPPLYVISAYNSDSTTLLGWVRNSEDHRRRVVGVNFASTTQTTVLNAYASRFVQAGNPASALGSENYYDAMYFAIDSLVGAASSATHPGPLSGTDLGGGMLRLIAPAGTPYNMGPTDMGNIFATLDATNTNAISLTGALGSPVFNTATGARVGQGDVYCITINPASDAGPASTTFAYDALRLTPSSDGGAPVLAGATSCAPGL